MGNVIVLLDLLVPRAVTLVLLELMVTTAFQTVHVSMVGHAIVSLENASKQYSISVHVHAALLQYNISCLVAVHQATMGLAVNYLVCMDHTASTVLQLVSAKTEQTAHQLMVNAAALLGGQGAHVINTAQLDHMG